MYSLVHMPKLSVEYARKIHHEAWLGVDTKKSSLRNIMSIQETIDAIKLGKYYNASEKSKLIIRERVDTRSA